MNKLRQYKWLITWTAFAVMVGLFVFIAIYFNDRPWLSNALQTIGTISGVYLTIIVFLQSKEESDKHFQNQLDHLQRLNAEHIHALQSSTDKQIKTLQEINTKQISALQELTDKQITALQELTEKQIDALHKTTFKQILSFEQQIREVTNKLSDNSILLAEILGRELEKSLDLYNNAIKIEEAKYSNLSGWKLLRTPAERERQLNNQWNRIQQIKKGYEYLMTKYKQLKEFLGFGQKKLNG